jgi:hypothetical protein
MLNLVAHLELGSHSVNIKQDQRTGRVYCFKYTERQCDFAQFPDRDSAVDYVITPLPNLIYFVEVPGESES